MESPDRKPVLIKFWATWCNHCKEFAPYWDEFVAEDHDFDVAQVECASNPEICKNFGRNGYPAVMWFNPGDKRGVKWVVVHNVRQLDNFCLKMKHFPIRIITLDDIDSMKEVVVSTKFLLVTNSQESREFQQLKAIAEDYKHFSTEFYAIITDNYTTSLQAFTANSAEQMYSGDYSNESLTEFIHMHLFPFLSYYVPEIAHFHYYYNMTSLIVFAQKKFSKTTIETASKISKYFPAHVISCNRNPYICRYVFVGPKTRYMIYDQRNFKYWMHDEGEQETVLEWVDDVRNNRIPYSGPGNGTFSFVWQKIHHIYAAELLVPILLGLSILGIIVIVILIIKIIRLSKKQKEMRQARLLKKQQAAAAQKKDGEEKKDEKEKKSDEGEPTKLKED